MFSLKDVFYILGFIWSCFSIIALFLVLLTDQPQELWTGLSITVWGPQLIWFILYFNRLWKLKRRIREELKNGDIS